jgi:hypothetical protein
MSLNKIKLFSALTCLMFIGCKKSADQKSNPVNNPPLINQPSVKLLTALNHAGAEPGESFVFEYDGNNNLVKFYSTTDHGKMFPWYVYYENGKVDYIVSEGKSIHGGTVKSSMIFIYGTDGKCVKVLHKETVQGYSNDNAYFSNVNDSIKNFYSEFDSITYTDHNRVTEMYKLKTYNGASHPMYKIKFIYPNDNTDVPDKFEYYITDQLGNFSINESMSITTKTRDNPLYSVLWYCPFVLQTADSNSTRDFMALRILFDETSSPFDRYMALLPKGISGYTVTFLDHSTDRDSAVYNYTFPDSLHTKIYKYQEEHYFQEYVFEKK